MPEAGPRSTTTALSASPQSALVRIAQASTPDDELSGFRLMPLGIYSLEARIELARRAQRSLDLQYYVLENDPTGRLMLRQLRDAALRGVRVRLLLDDLFTDDTQSLLRALAEFPQVEVRLFNPFCCARDGGIGNRYAASLLDFARLNHRMHNKLFIADGVMALAGGRNIADEYFQRHAAQNFVDMDAFVMGAVVPELAAIFDRYWNSDAARPVQDMVALPGSAAEARAWFDAELAALPQAPPLDPPPVDLLGYGPVSEDLDAGRIGLVWAPARALADPPEKVSAKKAEAIAGSVTNDLRMKLWQAERELVITSPYLIPGKAGMATITGLRERGVKVTIVTNSLAATDEPLVHSGYAPYRRALLESGVDLYELSPTRTQRTLRLGMFGSSQGRLHAKTAVVDRKTVFIGSMNLDPRSEALNTELGIVIDSPELARELLRVINISKLQGAYRLRLQPDGPGLQWLTMDDEHEMILRAEPESSLPLRLHNFLFGLFVPDQLL